MPGYRSVMVEVGGERVDLGGLPGFSIGFKRRFCRDTGLNYSDGGVFENQFALVLYALRLLRPSTTEAEVEAMGLAVVDFVYAVMGAATERLYNPDGAAGDAGYSPTKGQGGKDVVWVPTPLWVMREMLKMAEVGKNDVVVDLGCGDGRVLVEAARRGAGAIGVEANPQMAALARRNTSECPFVRIIEADMFEVDLSTATVVFLYLLSGLNLRIRDKLRALPAGTRIVSHQFDMGAWEEDRIVLVGNKPAYLWVVK